MSVSPLSSYDTISIQTVAKISHFQTGDLVGSAVIGSVSVGDVVGLRVGERVYQAMSELIAT